MFTCPAFTGKSLWVHLQEEWKKHMRLDIMCLLHNNCLNFSIYYTFVSTHNQFPYVFLQLQINLGRPWRWHAFLWPGTLSVQLRDRPVPAGLGTAPIWRICNDRFDRAKSLCTPPFILSQCRVNTFLSPGQEHSVLQRARESACSALFAGRLPCRVKLIQIKECVGCLAGWNAVRVSTWQGGSRFFSTRKPVCDSAATQTLTHTKPPPIPLHLSFTTCHTVNDSYITYHRVSWRPWSYLQVYLWNLSSLSLSFVCLRVCALSGQDVPRHISQIDL